MDESSSFKDAFSSPLMGSCLHRRLGESAIISLARTVRNSDNQRTARKEYEPSEDCGTIDESAFEDRAGNSLIHRESGVVRCFL